ncbi:MAG: hypothetical protein ACI8P0_003016 [Planctomycetaceae bacterium]
MRTVLIAIRKQPLYSLTIALMIVSTGAGMMAQRNASHAASSAALATSAADNEDRDAFYEQSHLHSRRHDRIHIFALAVFLVGVASWVCSHQRKEPGVQGVPLLLTILAGLTHLLLV